ncbi:UNVERIFIED_CONTAM: hypothetical protein HDU68_010490 [Siphonaria sp. JEL0065]|nr:hypothetical protein HDU68_010490 [Siphonaria sp. JEL0065]
MERPRPPTEASTPSNVALFNPSFKRRAPEEVIGAVKKQVMSDSSTELDNLKETVQKYMNSHTTSLEIIAAKLGIPVAINRMSPNSSAGSEVLNETLLAAMGTSGQKLIQDPMNNPSSTFSDIVSISMPNDLEKLYKELESRLATCINMKKELTKVELYKLLNPYVESKRPVMKITGRGWFLEKVSSWWDSHSSQVFWLQGEAGCGKSTMTDIVMGHFSSCSTLPRAFGFYFNHKAELDSERFVKTLAFELAQTNASVNEAIQKNSESWFGKTNAPPPSVFDIFKAIISEPLGDAPILICIDALDECEPSKRQDLLELLGSSQLPKNIRFFVTSRLGELDLHDHLVDSEMYTFSVVGADNREDLMAFALSRLRGLKYLVSNPNLNRWANQIVDKCNGSFLTLVVAFETLVPKNETANGPKKPRSSIEFKSRFENFLQNDLSIESLYRSVLERMASPSENSFTTTVLELISVILCLKEPVDVESLAFFLDLDPDSVSDVCSWISPLLKSQYGKVEFKHKTVYEFLMTDVGMVGSLNLRLANRNIGSKCVELLSHANIPLGDDAYLYRVFVNAIAPPDLVVADVPTPALKYALSYWIRHFEGSPSELDMQPFLRLYSVSSLLAAFEFNIIWLVHEILTLVDKPWGESTLLKADSVCHHLSKSPLIYSSAKAANTEMCLHLLQDGNADTRSRGWTPRQFYGEHSQCVMHEAIKSKSLETVKVLLQFTKDAGVLLLKDDFGWTALDYALGDVANYCRMFRRQREFEAGIGEMDHFFVDVWENRLDVLLPHPYQKLNSIDCNRTALHYASERGFLGLVEFLLAQKVSPDSQDTHGWTPLHCAAENGFDDVVQVLLKARATVNLQTTDTGSTSLHFACIQGNIRVASLLMDEGAILDSISSNSSTPLHHAAQYGHLALVKKFVESGANKIAGNFELNTPIHLAASYGHTAIVDYLLDQGVDVDVLNYYQRNPLHLAVDNDCLDTVRLLISRGSSLNLVDNVGRWTPLLMACGGGFKQVASLLLEKGANVDALDKCGKSALHLAAEKGCKEIVRELLQYSANVNSRSSIGWTPILSAVDHDQHDVVDILLPVSDLSLLSDVWVDSNCKPCSKALETRRFKVHQPLD